MPPGSRVPGSGAGLRGAGLRLPGLTHPAAEDSTEGMASLGTAAGSIAAAALSLSTLTGPASAAASPSGSPAAEAPVVHVTQGTLRGSSAEGVDSFLGIPYAAPPVGRLRWRPPRPAGHWQGVRDATQYGARCAALESTNGPRSDAEDCLFVNVQRPTGARRSAHLPVYVFIHGGGLVNGSSNQAGGEKIVREGHAVVVSMNYRLGVLGFLGLPGLARSGAGNFGFLDQQAALRWVGANIRAFGGDPRRVTVGGESAGAFSVCGHLVARGSRGLFAQAMMQSGSCYSRTRAQTRADSVAAAEGAGCADAATRLACLRRQSAAALLDATASFSPTLTSGTRVFPVPLQDAVDAGRFTRVPLVFGANRDEGRTFMAGAIGWTEQEYAGFVTAVFGDLADAVLARYPWPAEADQLTPAYLAGAIFTDAGLAVGIGGCPSLQLTETFARYVRTYAYEFAARRGPGLQPIPGYVWGAGHAAELAYLFPGFDNGTPIAPTFDAGERQLARDMVRYWSRFVFTGHPGGRWLAPWPAYDAMHRIMSLRPAGRSHTISRQAYLREHSCGFWQSLAGPSAAMDAVPGTGQLRATSLAARSPDPTAPSRKP